MYYKGFSRLMILLALGMHIQQGSVRLETHGHGCLAGFVGAADAESDGVPTSPVEPPAAGPDASAPAESPENGLQDVVVKLRTHAQDYLQPCDFVRKNAEQYPKDVKVCDFVKCCTKQPYGDPKSTGEDCFLELVANLIVDDVNIQDNCNSTTPTYSLSDCKFVSCCAVTKSRGGNLENMGKDCYDCSYNRADSVSCPPEGATPAAAASPSTLTTPVLYGLNMVTLVYFL